MSEAWCDFLAGWFGGVVGLLVGHPFDTLKVRQQTAQVGSGGIVAIAKSTYQYEGVRGFYKGMLFPMFSTGLYNSIFFGLYGSSLRFFQSLRSDGDVDRKMCCQGPPTAPYWHLDVFLAGCIAGTATVLYSCPVEVIKIKLQTQNVKPSKNPTICNNVCRKEPIYQNPRHATISIVKHYGLFKGLYKGSVCMMWRDVPTFGLYILSYEHMLCMFKDPDDRSHHTSRLSQAVAGGVAGVLSWIPFPLDVIKTRLQADDFGHPRYKGMIDCGIKTYREGIDKLFLGTTLMTLRAFVVAAATFLSFEYIHKQCEKPKPETKIPYWRRLNIQKF